jgi:hypothetical protein
VVCKGEAKTGSSIIAMSTPKLVDNTIGGNLRDDGRELTIEVPDPDFPGGKFLLSSTGLSPSFLKQWRDGAKADEEARRVGGDL